jgi:hypothetical protein
VDYSTYFLNYQKTVRDVQAPFVQTGAMVGVGLGVTIATGGVGPYLAGTGAVGGMSMALDPKVRHSLATGNWVGAMAHGSYHLPFIGNGRNSWDAWQMGKPWSAAGHAGLFSIDALGMRSAGKVRGTVWGGGVKSSSLQSCKVSTWNIGDGAVNKQHHNWHKIFGAQKPTLEQIKPYVKEALSKGQWKEIGPIITKKGNKGIITGTKVELIHQIENNKIWVLGKRTLDGELIINNAGVK